jgi:hypothetical protein
MSFLLTSLAVVRRLRFERRRVGVTNVAGFGSVLAAKMQRDSKNFLSDPLSLRERVPRGG